MAQSNMGNILLRLGNLGEAERALREAVRLRPEVASIRMSLGATLLRSKEKLIESRREFEEAIRAGPSTETARTAWFATLAVGGSSVNLVDLASGAARSLPAANVVVTGLAFSPDGSTIAGSTSTGPVLLWNAATGRPLGSPLSGATTTTTDVAFSPDGRTVAASSADDTVLVWDTASHEEIGPPLRASEAPATSVAFSPDGSTIASSGIDGTVALWYQILFRFDPSAVLGRLCGLVGRNLTQAEWNEFLPGQPYRRTCPALPAGS
jgi:hypothetical protein